MMKVTTGNDASQINFTEIEYLLMKYMFFYYYSRWRWSGLILKHLSFYIDAPVSVFTSRRLLSFVLKCGGVNERPSFSANWRIRRAKVELRGVILRLSADH
jgi:hypothetical protein